MSGSITRLILTCLVPLIPAAVAAADDGRVHLAQAPFTESFVGNPNVSGGSNVLVGLQLGRSKEVFDPKEIGVPVSSDFSARRSCIQISSRDGRYSAENAYELPVGAGISALDLPTRYGQQLSKLTFDDLAVLVRDVPTCSAATMGSLVPARLPLHMSGDLVVLINPGFARAEARLLRGSAEVVGPTQCVPVGDDEVRIAYSARCVLTAKAPLGAGRYVLKLMLDETTSRYGLDFDVLVP